MFDKSVDVICDAIACITPRLTPAQKAKLAKVQQAAVTLLAHQGWLTSDQAATINRLIGRL